MTDYQDRVSFTDDLTIKFDGENSIDFQQLFGYIAGIESAYKASLDAEYHNPEMKLKIRYDIQLGMIVLPKTANPEHMKSNADVDFVITDEDMDALKRVETIKDYDDHSFFPVFGGKM